MEHSFLLREGVWRATGTFWDATGSAAQVEGETRIVHADGQWTCEGVMRIAGSGQGETRTRYEVTPFAPGGRAAHWTSHSHAFGALRGRFVVAGDAILSFYASATGRYRGFECIQRIGDAHYRARGTLVEDDRILSTWAVELKSRIKSA